MLTAATVLNSAVPYAACKSGVENQKYVDRFATRRNLLSSIPVLAITRDETSYRGLKYPWLEVYSPLTLGSSISLVLKSMRSKTKVTVRRRLLTTPKIVRHSHRLVIRACNIMPWSYDGSACRARTLELAPLRGGLRLRCLYVPVGGGRVVGLAAHCKLVSH